MSNAGTKKAEPQPRLSVKSPSSVCLPPCPCGWKYAGASHLRKYLVINHLQFSRAPRSVFLWRLGCNASWKIRRVAACMADSAKPVAPKFFHVSRSAFTVNHFRHCRLTKRMQNVRRPGTQKAEPQPAPSMFSDGVKEHLILLFRLLDEYIRRHC